ncbi:helix-turn-helix transcriptional regulator [Gordonia malaquae]|uniref:helix-turn-helix domain-containing protein n=1 Tax=Gordonia malaquae TaxID=410332 RepID=UPI0030FE6E89
MTTIAANRPGLAKLRRIAKLEVDREFAAAIHTDPSTVSRVLSGKTAPGAQFIAGCIAYFGADCFEDCFVVRDDAA